jgi:NitT/TauT family transport system substrate-binding protein
MKRRSLFVHAGQWGVALAATGLGACAPPARLKVAINPWIGFETLRLAMGFRYLPESVLLFETKGLAESSMLMATGKVDAACLTLDEVLRVRATGVPLTVALGFDVSEGGDVVMAMPGTRTLADLAGKRIGVESGPLGALMLRELLRTAKLPRASVTVVDVSTDQQLQTWRAGHIDVAITYEPVATLLQREGGARIFDSRQLPDTIFDVLAVRTDRIGPHQEALEALLRGHFLGLKHIAQNREDATYRMAATLGVSYVEVRQALMGVRLPSLQANREYLASSGGQLQTAAASLSTLMAQEGLLARPDDLADLSRSTWLPALEVQ